MAKDKKQLRQIGVRTEQRVQDDLKVLEDMSVRLQADTDAVLASLHELMHGSRTAHAGA